MRGGAKGGAALGMGVLARSLLSCVLEPPQQLSRPEPVHGPADSPHHPVQLSGVNYSCRFGVNYSCRFTCSA